MGAVPASTLAAPGLQAPHCPQFLMKSWVPASRSFLVPSQSGAHFPNPAEVPPGAQRQRFLNGKSAGWRHPERTFAERFLLGRLGWIARGSGEEPDPGKSLSALSY